VRYELKDKPDFSIVHVDFEAPGEQILVEASAMVARNSGVAMKTEMKGGLLAAAKRKMLGGESLFQNTFTSSQPSVNIDTKWGGTRGFFSGQGLFLLKAEGTGPLFFASYGGIHTVDVGSSGYICDTSHIVGFTGGLRYDVTKVSGMKSLFFSGEGLVCRFTGQGRLWIATRNPGALASFLDPYRRVERGSQ